MVRGAGSRKGKESDMYTFDSRVRYSETDEEGNLSVVGIMNYLQDCSTFQSEDLKLGISYLNEEKTGVVAERMADRDSQTAAFWRADPYFDLAVWV